MMRLGLSARDRRTLVFGATTVALLAGGARGAPVARAWAADRHREAMSIAEQRAHARRAARLLPAMRDSLRARRARLEQIDSSRVSAPSPAAAAARLASIVEDIADESAVKIVAVQMRSDSTVTGSSARVGVRLTCSADIVGLVDFLRAIDTAAVPLVVRELTVTQPEPAAPPTKVEILRIDLAVESLARIRAGAGT